MTPAEDFARSLGQISEAMNRARAGTSAAREPVGRAAGQLQRVLDGSSNASAESAIESSQKAAQLVDDAVILLEAAITRLSTYMAQVLGQQMPPSSAEPASTSPTAGASTDGEQEKGYRRRARGPISSQARKIADHARQRFDEGALDHHVQGVPDSQLEDYVDDVLEGELETDTKYDAGSGRAAHWDPARRAIVIENGDAGTVFTPKEGRTYHDDIW